MTNWLTGLRLDSLDSVCLSGNSKRTHDESSESEQWQRPVLSSLLLSTRWLAYKKEISSAASTDSFAVTMVAKVAPLKKVCSLYHFSSSFAAGSTLPHFLQWTPNSYCVFTFFFVVWCIVKKKHKKHYTACIVLADWVDDELLLFFEKEEKERVLLTRQISDGGKSYVCVMCTTSSTRKGQWRQPHWWRLFGHWLPLLFASVVISGGGATLLESIIRRIIGLTRENLFWERLWANWDSFAWLFYRQKMLPVCVYFNQKDSFLFSCLCAYPLICIIHHNILLLLCYI